MNRRICDRPDFEWRTFDEIKQQDISKIMSLERFDDKTSVEKYIMLLTKPEINIKFRGDCIKIKELVYQSDDGIQGWKSYEFLPPFSRNDVNNLDRFFEMFGVSHKERFSIEKYYGKNVMEAVMAFPFENILPISVKKERHMRLYEINYERNYKKVGIEISKVELFGTTSKTIGIEAKTEQDVRKVLSDLRLDYHPKDYNKYLSEKVLENYGTCMVNAMQKWYECISYKIRRD